MEKIDTHNYLNQHTNSLKPWNQPIYSFYKIVETKPNHPLRINDVFLNEIQTIQHHDLVDHHLKSSDIVFSRQITWECHCYLMGSLSFILRNNKATQKTLKAIKEDCLAIADETSFNHAFLKDPTTQCQLIYHALAWLKGSLKIK